MVKKLGIGLLVVILKVVSFISVGYAEEDTGDNTDYWNESQELMSVEDFQGFYNEEINQKDSLRGQLVRVRKVAEFNNGANWISIMAVNNQVVFCIDPTVSAGIGMDYSQSSDWKLLSWDTQQRIWLVVRFGYQQYGSDDYYIASQVLIWRAMGHWITPSVNVDHQIAQIESNIQSYGVPPSFNNQTLEVEYSKEKKITDTNGVLNNYSISCPGGVDCMKAGNDLTVTIRDLNYDKNKNVVMSSSGTNDPSWVGVVWVLPGSQSVASVSPADPSTRFNLNLKMATGDLKIIKVDEYGLAAGKGHKFEIALDDQFINKIGVYETNQDGILNVTETLPSGKYYVKEVETVNGYIINPDVYEVEIELNQVTEIKIENSLKEVELHYFKLDEEWNEILLNGAGFSVTDITEADEFQVMDDEGNLLWEDEEKMIPLMDFENETYEFSVETGNQYIRLYSPTDRTQPYYGEVEISQNESFDHVETFKTTPTGLLEISQVSLKNLRNSDSEDEEETMYYYRISSDLKDKKSLSKTFTLLSEEDRNGWVNMPLKWGRKYNVCEIYSPQGYQLPENSCKVVSMDLEDGVSFSSDQLTNKRRRIDLEVVKQNEKKTLFLSGAVFTIEKVLKEYEIESIKSQLTEEEIETWQEPETMFMGEYITGAVLINDEEGSVYQILNEELEVIFTDKIGSEKQLVKYLPNGKYIIQRMIDDKDQIDPSFDSYEVQVSEGGIVIPDLLYGHEYKVCETRAPSGYLIEENGCEIVLIETDENINTYHHTRLNKMIEIPIMEG